MCLSPALYRSATPAPPDSFALRVEPFHSRRARSPQQLLHVRPVCLRPTPEVALAALRGPAQDARVRALELERLAVHLRLHGVVAEQLAQKGQQAIVALWLGLGLGLGLGVGVGWVS